jgi:hypothetical protein
VPFDIFPPGSPFRFMQPAPQGVTPGEPAAPLYGAGENRTGPFINRVPQVTERERRFFDLLSGWFNCFVRRGFIIQGKKADDWMPFIGGFAAARDPGADDDTATLGAYPGAAWVNTETLTLWFMRVGTTGTAVWEEAGGGGEPGPQGEQGPAGAAGANGMDGADGADGVGVPAGGTDGQVLTKQSGTDFDTGWEDPTGGGGGTTVTVSDFASRPAAGNSGNIWMPTDVPWISYGYDDGSNWHNHFNGLRCTTPPAAGNWSVHNAVNGTATHSKGAILMTHSDSALTTPFFYKKSSALGSATFKITAGFFFTQGRTVANAYQSGAFGLGLLEAATGELVLLECDYDNTAVTPQFTYAKWTNATTFSAVYMNREELAGDQPIFIQIEVDGSNRYARYSNDGVNFSTLWTVGRTDFSQGDTPVLLSFGRNATAVCFHYKEE